MFGCADEVRRAYQVSENVPLSDVEGGVLLVTDKVAFLVGTDNKVCVLMCAAPVSMTVRFADSVAATLVALPDGRAFWRECAPGAGPIVSMEIQEVAETQRLPHPCTVELAVFLPYLDPGTAGWHRSQALSFDTLRERAKLTTGVLFDTEDGARLFHVRHPRGEDVLETVFVGYADGSIACALCGEKFGTTHAAHVALYHPLLPSVAMDTAVAMDGVDGRLHDTSITWSRFRSPAVQTLTHAVVNFVTNLVKNTNIL